MYVLDYLAREAHLGDIIAFLDRVCRQKDFSSRLLPLLLHSQHSFDSLVVCSEDLVQLALKVSNEIVSIIVIMIENFNFYYLVSLKLVVDVENFVKVRIEVVSPGLGPAKFRPLLVFLCLKVDDGVWVALVSWAVDVNQAATCD